MVRTENDDDQMEIRVTTSMLTTKAGVPEHAASGCCRLLDASKWVRPLA